MATPPEVPGKQAPAAEEISDAFRRELEARLAPKVQNRGIRHEIVEETLEVAIQFSGPVPPPAILRGINDIVPGAADRIIAMAENEQAHAHDMDRRRALYPFLLELSGTVAGVIVTALGLVLASYCIVNGNTIAGTGLFGVTLGGIVLAFIKGRGPRNNSTGARPPPRPTKKRRP